MIDFSQQNQSLASFHQNQVLISIVLIKFTLFIIHLIIYLFVCLNCQINAGWQISTFLEAQTCFI